MTVPEIIMPALVCKCVLMFTTVHISKAEMLIIIIKNLMHAEFIYSESP